MPTGIRIAGEFCWFNILTPQPVLAREFFSTVLGWTYTEIPGMGHRAQVLGCDVGGIFDLAGPSASPGTLPHMGGLVKVASADSTVEKVLALGGQASPAFDIADQGRIAACTDPSGVRFTIWEPNTFLGTDVDSTLHGAPSWFEALTTDVDRAMNFYAGVFGWIPEPMTPVPPASINYTLFKLSGAPVAGMLQITPRMEGISPHWVTYFTVDDADEAVQLAVQLGASIYMTMKEAPGVGRFCGITSPQGVTFYVIQYPR